MRDQEIVGLWESYLEVCDTQQLDELSSEVIARTSHKRMQNLDAAQKKEMGARDAGATMGEISKRSEETSDAAAKVSKNRRLSSAHARSRSRMNKEDVDIFDVILEHLVDEGYADTNESAIAIMANMSEEWREDIMEISRKTATSAYAKSATGEFEGADSDHDIKRTDNLGKHIERKFGKKALEDADRHADSSTFGRKDPRTGKRQPKPESRFQNPNKYRTTKDGKMHGQDQNKLKAKLERRRGED
jgi:hypothetical protein